MKQYTQEECRAEWEQLKRDIIRKIGVIDSVTPAEPTVEPKWWQEMIQVERALRASTPKTPAPAQ